MDDNWQEIESSGSNGSSASTGSGSSNDTGGNCNSGRVGSNGAK